jgi:hypothetical protein
LNSWNLNGRLFNESTDWHALIVTMNDQQDVSKNGAIVTMAMRRCGPAQWTPGGFDKASTPAA